MVELAVRRRHATDVDAIVPADVKDRHRGRKPSPSRRLTREEEVDAVKRQRHEARDVTKLSVERTSIESVTSTKVRTRVQDTVHVIGFRKVTIAITRDGTENFLGELVS
mmetsp:Transcript_93103/g.262931  ORF Transcript_93103/g.262931 Transcript_93103/m.262931 type:complete len:109 (-) Transcript_93103:267-593(-)